MQLGDHPLLAGCAPSTVERLAAAGQLEQLAPGQRVLVQGSAATRTYFLLDGVVRVLIADPDGSEITAKLFVAPALFGEMEALTQTTYIESVEVMRAATLLSLEAAALLPVLDLDARLSRNILLDVCRRFRTSALNQAFVAFEDVERRLAALVSSYLRVFGVPVAGGVQLIVDHLSLAQLGQGIAANEKSVRRTFRSWTERRWLARRGRYYVILAPEKLLALAGDDAPRLDYQSEH